MSALQLCKIYRHGAVGTELCGLRTASSLLIRNFSWDYINYISQRAVGALFSESTYALLIHRLELSICHDCQATIARCIPLSWDLNIVFVLKTAPSSWNGVMVSRITSSSTSYVRTLRPTWVPLEGAKYGMASSRVSPGNFAAIDVKHFPPFERKERSRITKICQM